MPRVRITLLSKSGLGHTIEATNLPPIEFDVPTKHLLPFMQALSHLTPTPDLLVAAIIAMDNAVNLTRQEAEHP